MKTNWKAWVVIAILATAKLFAQAQQKVIIDTDIGDDVDDAFAVTLALSSPELKIIGITSAWGDTELRSRMLDRLLCEAGRSDILVTTGIRTASKTQFTQEVWARAGASHTHGDAVDFLLEQIRKKPGEITLIAIAPLSNIGAAIDRDPATFRKLKRVVMMGGSIHRGYDNPEYLPAHGPDAEYNIAMDPIAAQKLFRSGVPVYVMPLDATQLPFDETKRQRLSTVSTPLTDMLQLLVAEWQRVSRYVTPIMFDDVAVAYAVQPEICSAAPMHIEVDASGFTRGKSGPPNANVCLSMDSDKFFAFLMPRLLKQNLHGSSVCTGK